MVGAASGNPVVERSWVGVCRIDGKPDVAGGGGAGREKGTRRPQAALPAPKSRPDIPSLEPLKCISCVYVSFLSFFFLSSYVELLQNNHLPCSGHFTLVNMTSIPADLLEHTHYTLLLLSPSLSPWPVPSCARETDFRDPGHTYRC